MRASKWRRECSKKCAVGFSGVRFVALENDPMRERALSSGANRGGDAESERRRQRGCHPFKLTRGMGPGERIMLCSNRHFFFSCY